MAHELIFEVDIDVSIIVPVYNVAPYIADCLRSVMQQTYMGNMECLIIDDCGTDESIAIAQRMISEYNDNLTVNHNLNGKGKRVWFRVLYHEQNRGLSAARNTGTELAKGDYLFYLDSDDEITPDCIDKMMAMIKKDPSVEMVQGNTYTCKDGLRTPFFRKIRITQTRSNDEVRRCFYHNRQMHIAAWNKLMRRSFVQENNLYFLEGVIYEDTPWTFYCLKYIKKACFLSDITYHYKSRPNSIVRATNKRTEDVHRLKGLHEIVTHLTPGYEKEEISYYVIGFASIYTRNAYKIDECDDIFRFYWEKAKLHHCYFACTCLAAAYMLGKSKWGRGILPILIRLGHPRLILQDIKRVKGYLDVNDNVSNEDN